MSLKSWLLGALGVVMATVGCAHAQKPKPRGEDMRPAYVDVPKAPATIRAGQTLEVVVAGNLPDPAWELVEVEVQRSELRVVLTPWIRRAHRGMSMQVLVPFERKVPLDGLTPGRWTVEVRGHGDTSERVEVEVLP